MINIPAWARPTAQRFLDAGWHVSDVLHALDTRPDGSEWTYTPHRHGTPQWAVYRLSVWLDGFGQPYPPRSQVLAEQVARQDAEQQHDRQRWAELRAARLHDVEPAARRAREMLAAASLRAASQIRRREVQGQARRSQAGASEDQSARDREARMRWELLDEQAQAAIRAGAVTEVWMPPADEEPIDPRTLARERALAKARREKRNGSGVRDC
ncbi:hypothetical protein [Nonomuraea angiospora]